MATLFDILQIAKNSGESYHRSSAMGNTAFLQPANGRILEITLALGGAMAIFRNTKSLRKIAQSIF